MSKLSVKNKYLAFVILIGGKSIRFGSEKGIFEFLGKPLIMYQIETLSQLDYDIFLVANTKEQIDLYQRKIKDYEKLNFILDDKEIFSKTNERSPLIGIFTALKELDKKDYERGFVMSCDIPLININVVKLLIQCLHGYECCVPKWKNGFLEPLFAIYPVHKALLMAERNLNKGLYKLTAFINPSWKVNYISVENSIQPLDIDLLSFININSQEDVKKLTNTYKKEKS